LNGDRNFRTKIARILKVVYGTLIKQPTQKYAFLHRLNRLFCIFSFRLYTYGRLKYLSDFPDTLERWDVSKPSGKGGASETMIIAKFIRLEPVCTIQYDGLGFLDRISSAEFHHMNIVVVVFLVKIEKA